MMKMLTHQMFKLNALKISTKANFLWNLQCKFTTHTDSSLLYENEIHKFLKENAISIIGQNEHRVITNFHEANLDERILRILTQKFQNPTPIQAVGWPIALKGQNLVGIAETGCGKTLSYVIPSLMHILEKEQHKKQVDVIIVSPTRELCTQILDEANPYCREIRIGCVAVYGGAPKGSQLSGIRRGARLIAATPGRLKDIIENNGVNISSTTMVVLDEADRMLDMGFSDDIKQILNYVDPNAQLIMYSATWPKKIEIFAKRFLKEHIKIKIGSEEDLSLNPNINQNFIFCRQPQKLKNLLDIFKSFESGNETLPKTIIFVNKKYICEDLKPELDSMYPNLVDSIHSDKTQGDRSRILKDFKTSRLKILIATNVAARGLDVNDVQNIINYDLPDNIEDYVHRIGRTGRNGKKGDSHSLFTEENSVIAKDLIDVLKRVKQEVPQELENYAQENRMNKSKKSGGYPKRNYNNSNRRNFGNYRH